MGSTVLLTGGTGFLGRNLMTRLLHEGFRVVLLKRSTSRVAQIASDLAAARSYDVDTERLSKAFEENRIDAIVHCATNYGRNCTEPTDVIEANLTLPLRLLQCAKRFGVRRFINADTVLGRRIGFYSLSKSQFLEWLDYYTDETACVNVVLENFYGPLDDESKFITRVVLQMLQGVERIALTPGRQKRGFVYIDDVVDAFVRVIRFSLEQQRGSFRFEVGNPEKLEIRQIVELVQRFCGNTRTALDFGALPYRPNEVMESVVDTSTLVALGWNIRVPVDEGLMMTIMLERRRLGLSGGGEPIAPAGAGRRADG